MIKKILKYLRKNSSHQASHSVTPDVLVSDENPSVSSALMSKDILPAAALVRIAKRIDKALANVSSVFAKQTQSIKIEFMGMSKSMSREVADVRQSVMAVNDQLAAIRDYAANQQQHLQRFQDGYDLKILKDLSLRIMRCVDMVEHNMKQHSVSGQHKEDLEELRDELLFCMEGVGIGSWRPEIGSLYRGNEATVEIAGMTPALNPEDSGKIAEVRRNAVLYSGPGGSKLVRSAQVIVFNTFKK